MYLSSHLSIHYVHHLCASRLPLHPPLTSTCKVPSYVARQRGTSRRRVGSNGGSGAVGVLSRSEPGARAEGEREAEAEVEAEAEAEGKVGGVPLTVPSDNFHVFQQLQNAFCHYQVPWHSSV